MQSPFAAESRFWYHVKKETPILAEKICDVLNGFSKTFMRTNTAILDTSFKNKSTIYGFAFCKREINNYLVSFYSVQTKNDRHLILMPTKISFNYLSSNSTQLYSLGNDNTMQGRIWAQIIGAASQNLCPNESCVPYWDSQLFIYYLWS